MPELLDKRLVFVTGKGGVGKSTISIALGLAAAPRGKRTIVCEVGGQETASRVFRRAEIGFHEVEVAENLWAISIDPDQSLREYLLLQLKVRAMRDMLVRSRVFNYLAGGHARAQGAGHDREDLGARPAQPQGEEGAASTTW